MPSRDESGVQLAWIILAVAVAVAATVIVVVYLGVGAGILIFVGLALLAGELEAMGLLANDRD